MKKSSHTLGLVLGGLFGLWHALWSLLVAIGAAKPLMDWVFTLHMIRVQYTLLPFDPTKAIVLVVVTAIMGYVMGWLAGAIWEKVAKK